MKLVRDKIPEIIRRKGGTPKIQIADNKMYWEFLKKKLLEEVEEFLKEENVEELADILEVIHTICRFKNWDFEEVENFRAKKRKEKGGFERRIILIGIEEP